MKNVEDVYPLSPMQETMLFHACTQASKDVLFNQSCHKMVGELDEPAFHQAWQLVLNRHAVLRTGFVWKGLKRPQQVVRQQLKVPYETIDLRDKNKSEIDGMIDVIRLEDRRQGFSPERAPLIRLKLIQVEVNINVLIWSSHHLILDRWCIPIVFSDLFSIYNKLKSGRTIRPEKALGFRNFVSWIKQQNEQSIRDYWSSELSGVSRTIPLTKRKELNEASPVTEDNGSVEVSGKKFAQLNKFCSDNQLTKATVVQGAWSLLLNSYGGEQDVIFGVVTSGRPPALPDVEAIVGSFVNNLPVRVQLPSNLGIVPWLKSIQVGAIKRAPYEYISVSKLQSWCDLNVSQTLFDSIIVWLAASDLAEPEGLEVSHQGFDMGTAYPLTLSVEERDDALRLSIRMDNRFEPLERCDLILEKLIGFVDELSLQYVGGELKNIAGFYGDKMHDSFLSHDSNITLTTNYRGEDLHNSEQLDLVKGREQLELDSIQEYVSSEWLQVLELGNIPANADFFEFGGNSLKAAQLLARVEQGTRKSIPLLSLFQSSTIEGMAKTILSEDWPLTANIAIPIKKQGEMPPLFCIASPEVNTIGYSIMSRYLSDKWPVFVLQSPPDFGMVRQLQASELPVLAKEYVESMLEIQSEGYFNILGMCTGSHLALEIGRQLEAEGREVRFLGIVNTWAFFTVSKLYYVQKLLNRLAYYKNRIVELFELEPKRRINLLSSIIKNWLSPSNQHVSATSSNGAHENRDNDILPVSEDNYSLIDDVGWAHLKSNIQKYTGTVTVIKIQNQPFWRIRDGYLGWRMHANTVETITIPGDDHLEILREPYVRDVAEKIQSCLNEHVG